MPTQTTTRTAADLEEAVRNGDTTISPDDIAAARQREEHAELLAEADRRAGVRDAEADRARSIAALRGAIEAVESRTDEQREYASAAVAALEDLVESVQARAATVRELGARARELGILELDGQNNTSDDSRIGWKFDHLTRGVSRIRIDDRMVGCVDPRHILNRLLHEFLASHKIGSTDHVPHQALTDLLTGQDQLVRPPKTARVRLLQRHGHRPAGTVAEYELATANWLIGKKMAEPAA